MTDRFTPANDEKAHDWLNRCHFGDVREVLRRMAADGVKVQTIITSPPYWGLRSYLPAGHPLKGNEIGSEPTFREFLESMVGVFELCRQVLAEDGTMWVNMGDSYANDGKTGGETGGKQSYLDEDNRKRAGREKRSSGLSSKNLLGQPWRLAFALQDAGWTLRSDIIWNKPNPMPESVSDRPTKSHEYIFLLTKSENYYCDMEAILEPVSPNTHARLSQDVQNQIGSARANGGGKTNGNMKAVGRKLAANDSGTKNNGSFDKAMAIMPSMRNKRTVWTVATESYKGAHFATFPTKLIEPCILAGAAPGRVVLDIFMGSGTTAQVSEKLGRPWIGIDIDERNRALQTARLQQRSLMLDAA